MKIRLLMLFFVFSVYQASAQFDVDLGLKVGYNNSKITEDSYKFSSSTINSYHVGAFTRLNFSRIYIQPEAYYSSKGGEIEDIVSNNLLVTVSSFNYDVIDVPVLVGVKVLQSEASNFRIYTGPVFSFLTDSSVESDNNNFSKEYYEDHLFGWHYGVGVDFLMFTLDARIERSLNKVYSGPELDSKNHTFLISLGIKLF